MNPVIVRRVQIGLLIVGTVITVMALVLIAACFRNDATINASKATVMADVVNARLGWPMAGTLGVVAPGTMTVLVPGVNTCPTPISSTPPPPPSTPPWPTP